MGGDRIKNIGMNRTQLFLFLFLLPLLFSCKGGKGELTALPEGDTIPLQYAKNLTLVRYPGFVKADIRNPWDSTRNLRTYLLVPDSLPLPQELPEGTVIRTPLKNSLVYSSVHQSLVDELGKADAIGGIVDYQYITRPSIRQLVETGKAVDCGTITSPNLERIIRLNPDAIILSPFESSGTYGKIDELGIPVIESADYTENHPLGRAEWMKFFGLLYGRDARAWQMFGQTEAEYENIRSRVKAEGGKKPRVLLDALYGQTWNLPGDGSLMDTFIRDAGGENPFSGMGKGFNLPLSGEQVLHRAKDADIWLVRYWQDKNKSLEELGKDNPLYPQFDAFRNGNVYGCNTKYVEFFEDVPFHPQWFLAELASLLQPDIKISAKYFTKL